MPLVAAPPAETSSPSVFVTVSVSLAPAIKPEAPESNTKPPPETSITAREHPNLSPFEEPNEPDWEVATIPQTPILFFLHKDKEPGFCSFITAQPRVKSSFSQAPIIKLPFLRSMEAPNLSLA